MSDRPAAPQPPPHAARAVPVLLLLVFVSLVGFGLVIPLLPFFAVVFDAAAWQVTLLFATFSAGQFAGELVWGRLSDRIGRRPVLLITIFASSLGYLALAFAPSIWLAILARGVSGFFAGNVSTIQGYIVDVTPRERLAGRLGLVGSAFGVGFVVGPSLGGLLARPELGAAGFRPPLEVAAGLGLLAGLGVLAFVKESRTGPRPIDRGGGPMAAIAEALRNPVLVRLLASCFLAFGAYSAMWSVLGLWGQARFGWGPRDIGLVMALTGLAAALSQGIGSGPLVRRFGEGAIIVIGLTATAFFLFGQAFSPWPWLAVVFLTASVLGHAAAQPATSSLVSRSTPPDQQGSILGAASAIGSLARVCGPVVGGLLYSGFGPWAPIVLSGVGMLPAAWLGWRAARALRRL